MGGGPENVHFPWKTIIFLSCPNVVADLSVYKGGNEPSHSQILWYCDFYFIFYLSLKNTNANDTKVCYVHQILSHTREWWKNMMKF